MTGSLLLDSIIANGGWCQLHYPKDKAISESIFARLIIIRSEFLLLEKLNLRSDNLSGYLVVLTNTKQRLKKNTFAKQIIRIGGKSLPDPNFSIFENIGSLMALLEYLQKLREPILVNQFDRSDLVKIIEFDSQQIICRLFNGHDPESAFEIQLKEISSLEIQTA